MRNPNPFKTREFQRLLREWEEKLRDSGFVDIETHQSKVYMDLVQRVSFSRQRTKEAVEHYYSWARQVSHTTYIQNHRFNRIWFLHAQGLSPAKIGQLTGFERSSVYKTIQRIKIELKEVEKEKTVS